MKRNTLKEKVTSYLVYRVNLYLCSFYLRWQLYTWQCRSVGLSDGVNEFQEAFNALKVHVMIMFKCYYALQICLLDIMR